MGNAGRRLTPNHVTNRLTVDGAPENVRRFFDAIHGDLSNEKNPILIDFNKIRPMPESLNIESGTVSEKALDYYVLELTEKSGTPAVMAALGDYAGEIFRRLPETLSRQRAGRDKEDMPDLLKLGERLLNNIREHGAPGWYDWRVRNWSTKWNAYNQARVDGHAIVFNTAWSGVPELMRALSEKFPSVALSYVYADEVWGSNTGVFEFEGGECTRGYRPPDYSPDAKEIAEALLGPMYSEEDEGENDEDLEDENDENWEQEDD